MQVKVGNIRLKKQLGGGSLYDIGIYCINAARYLYRAEPTEVFAYSARNDDPRFREVDEMTTGAHSP
jgi:glucose-fructose oxidoreductase